MLIAGAGGLGLEMLGLIVNQDREETVSFFDQGEDIPSLLYDKYPVLSELEEVKTFFQENSASFIVAVGQPRMRKKLTDQLENSGGKLVNFIANTASVFSIQIEYEGLIAQPGSGISHSTILGKSCSLHINSIIGHDVTIGEFVTIGPNVSIIGPAQIGSYCTIGEQVIVLPGSRIGDNVIIGAGSLVEGIIKDHETFVNRRS